MILEAAEPAPAVDATSYRLEYSHDLVRWRTLPLGYRQSGTIVDRAEGVVVQSTGRGSLVFYRAVAAEEAP